MGIPKTTLYDKVIKAAKNNPLIVAIMLFAVVITAFGPFYSGFTKFKDTVNKSAETKRGVQDLLENKQPIHKNLTINDPDGFLYIRSRATKESDVVGTIKANEYFDAYAVDGNWLLVKTNSGYTGYVYSTKVNYY